jgi:CPA1 family monovalent cation:H+ antiporter
LILTLTYCIVIFSIVVQGLTMGKVIRMSSRSTKE